MVAISKLLKDLGPAGTAEPACAAVTLVAAERDGGSRLLNAVR